MFYIVNAEGEFWGFNGWFRELTSARHFPTMESAQEVMKLFYLDGEVKSTGS